MTDQCDSCFFGRVKADALLHCCRETPKAEPPLSGNAGKWPVVEADDWCGEFSASDPGVYGTPPP